MRDLLIIAIVAVLAMAALRRPWIGVMLWTWLSIMNPHRFAWGLAYSAPLAAVAAIATMIGLLLSQEKQSPFQGPPVAWLMAFIVWVNLSWVLGQDPASDFELWSRFMKMSLMNLVALSLLWNRIHIISFVAVTAGSLALIGLKGGIFTLLTGGSHRVWGPPGSFVEGNNEFALALIMVIPLLRFLQLQAVQRWLKHLLTATILLCAVAAIGSYSRGAFLAIAAMGAMLWIRNDQKLWLGIVLILIVAFLPLMPDAWWERMSTIHSYQEDLSAIGRLNGWIVAREVALHHLFGAGMSYQYQSFFTLYGTYNANVIAAHSIYFQVLGNHGFFGLLLFLAIGMSTWRSARWLQKNAQGTPQAKWVEDLGAMVQVSMVGYAVGGAFLSLAYYDLPYSLIVVVVLARRWLETRGWERDPKMGILEYVGLSKKKPPATASLVPTPAGAARKD